MKNIESYRKDRLIELSESHGFSPDPGTHRILITKDKKIYYYTKTQHTLFKSESILDDKRFNKILEYIKNNIDNKSFERVMICDSSFEVITENKVIMNHPEINWDIQKILRGDDK